VRRVPLLLAVLLLCLAPLALVACGGDDDGESATTTLAAGTTAETDTTSTTSEGEATATTPSSTSPATVACVEVEQPAAEERTGKKPSEDLDTSKRYELTFETNCGSFTVTLDQEQAPKTAASLVALARDGYFDDTAFHRVVPGFVIQGGDPTGTGAGGPGYSTVDTPPADAKYTHGVVAMAKTDAEAAGTAGSQFFVVTAEDAGLPPQYAIVGRVTSGLEVVDAIGALGAGDGPPTQVVRIERATVAES
jgi:peptidyl-prolyl cis-trans isomerase B (cyclophilin B)